MSLAVLRSRALAGMEAPAVSVEVHLANGLPGLTIGLTTPDGFATTINLGFANAEARTPITGDTLFQVGSITKAMVAALLHQFAAEGRLPATVPQRLKQPQASPCPNRSPK